MNYETKQGWIEAVMADTSLTPAAKVYAYGIFQHMYGKKDNAWPGAKALSETTGLNNSKFYVYNKALVEAGYLEVTPRRGTSNEYHLQVPTPTGGTHLPPQGVTPPPEGVTPTPTGGTKTTKNTTKETSKEDINSASAPVDTSLMEEDIPTSILNQNPSFEEIVSPLLEDRRFSLPESDRMPSKHERIRAEQELAHARRTAVLADMGIDPDGEW